MPMPASAPSDPAAPAGNGAKRSFLQRSGVSQGDARVAHQRIRLAMYGVLVLVAALAAWQAWHGHRAESVRRIDAEIIRLAAEQSTLSQRMGALAVMLVAPGFDREERRAALGDTINQAQDQAQRLEELLRTQSALDAGASDTMAPVIDVWQQSRERLWYRAQGLLWQRDREDSGALFRSIQGLQQELETTLAATHGVVLAVQRAANARSDQALRQIEVQGALMLVLLALMAIGVVEPSARSVQKQHRALSKQALRLKRLALVAERSSNAVLLADAQLQVVWINDALTQMTGFALEHLLGRSMGTLLAAYQADQASLDEFTAAVRQGRGLKREVKVLVAGSADVLWLLADIQPIYTEGEVLTGWVMVATDLTALRSQQQLLSLAVDGAGLGTWQWEVGSGAMHCNDRLLEIMGYARGQIGMTSSEWNALIHPEDFPAWLRSVTSHLHDPTQVHRMSVRLKHQSGRWVWMMFAGTVVDRNLEGRATRMAGVAMDVQAQKAMELQLRTAARTDGLTQLPNRSVVLDMVQTAIERGQANQGYFFAVLFMDFDRFKQVNDTLGHGVGDDLLRQIARRLQDSLRPGDSMMHTSDCTQMAARIGGDEFVVLLDDIRGDLEAEIVASRLLDVLAVPYTIGAHKVNSTVSIGIVTSTHAATDADSVLRDADIAMYEAKRTGRAKYVMFDPSMGQRLLASVALENDLRQALDRHELSVVYQPLVDLKTGRVVSMEALMRWRQSDRGVVSPVEFIPVAEACGLIGPMGLFVLQTACSTFASLQTVLGERAPPTVAVNLSRAQLRQPGLAADVLDALRAAGMAAQQLVLEVTESLAAQDELVLATLHEIRALGVALSLDDFGTGYSSLSCLHELPVNFVKIDRSFVIEAQSSEYHRVLIEATIRMAQALKLGTVAEGIETPEQAALMAELGCNKGQGYLYSRPLDAQTLIDWIQARHGGQVPN